MLNSFKEFQKVIGGLLVVFICFLAISCSDNVADSSQYGTLNLSVSNRLSNGGQVPGFSPLQGAAISNITITSAKISIGRIRFNTVSDLDSLDFRSDIPIIVDLQIGTTVQSLGSISIPPGTYDETRFRIAKLDSTDGLVYIDNSDMRDLSIRVAGYVNGNMDSVFVWTADFNEEQRHNFLPFTIIGGDTVNVQFEFDQSNWFSDGLGGFYDPRESLNTGSVQSAIENNIKTAFEVREI